MGSGAVDPRYEVQLPHSLGGEIQAMKLRAIITTLLLMSTHLPAQVLTPMELPDPKLQHLQQRYMSALTAIGDEIVAHKFPYPFYMSRVLDLDLAKMPQADQRSIRFDIYQHQTVLEVTGNYYASYSADRMTPHARMKETFEKVVVPILRAEAAHFPDDSEFSAFAVEVSHHVRQKVYGLSSETPENVAVVIPVAAAQKLVDAKTEDQKQAAILEAEIYLNGEQYALWIGEGNPTDEWKEAHAPQPARKQPLQTAAQAPATDAAGGQLVAASLVHPAAAPPRIFTPESLALLQQQNQDAVDRMVKSLDGQAHFLPYAAPSFVGFRHSAYLQVSFTTSLEAVPESSRYKLAALAFDEHVSHLIRPVLDFFTGDANFDGIVFSSVIHTSGGTANQSKVESVEFFLPFRMMRCYGSYDCAGQQLLDSGTVLIDGERVALDLQVAEGKN
jgi:hypothetical protein